MGCAWGLGDTEGDCTPRSGDQRGFAAATMRRPASEGASEGDVFMLDDGGVASAAACVIGVGAARVLNCWAGGAWEWGIVLAACFTCDQTLQPGMLIFISRKVMTGLI